MNSLDQLVSHIPDIEKNLDYHFQNHSLLIQAFVHRSFFYENRSLVGEHNERLEFLGDSILGLIISEYLYLKMPGQTEGDLSHYRSHMVEASNCNFFLQKLGISSYILLGKGERINEGKARENISADLFEAILGAIYLDSNFEIVKAFFLKHFTEMMDKIAETPLRNWKAELQDICQKKHQKPPYYRVIKETGPEHSKIFQVAVFLGDRELGKGTGSSKKEAEQAAAENAMQNFSG